MNLEKQKILIVDDSPENIELLFVMLQDEYEVIFSTSGEKALKLAQDVQPDLILLDIIMPGIDGYEVIKCLKSDVQTKSIPVIFLTAKTSKNDLIKGFHLGSVDYIIKPFFEEEIKARLSTHLQNRILIKQLKLANKKLEKVSLSDALTGVANRRYFDQFLSKMFAISRRDEKIISLLMIDVDYFKKYNDCYGHVAGDECLQGISKLLDNFAQRGSDLAARYGGEEFAVVLPNMKLNDAQLFAKNCCQAVENLKIPHAKSPISAFVTISIGICCLTANQQGSVESLIKSADQALYKAKNLGRNQYVVSN